MTETDRAILHVDLDAFFASVEQLDDPRLRGRPVLVGYDGPRGVVMAASYESRAFGCHSAQPMAVAKRSCPDAVIVPCRGARYRELSRAVFDVLDGFTPVVEPLSIDEAFLDVTGSTRLHGAPRDMARDLKAAVRETTGLVASVGVAPNKFLAKLASDWDKPDGLTVIEPSDLPERLAPLPIKRMWGVGPAAEERLARVGIRTFGDLHALSREEATARLGPGGDRLWRLAHGQDQRRVTRGGGARSISTEQTFSQDVTAPDRVEAVLLRQSESVARRLRKAALTGRTVNVKIRYGAFETITRATTLAAPTDRTDVVWDAARALFVAWRDSGFRPVRLIGVGVTHLAAAGAGQLDLFVDATSEKRRRLDRVTDVIESRFGHRAIRRGSG